MTRREQGQATVELALLLPFLVTALLGVVQVAVLGGQRVAVTHAAREGVRAAVVNPDPATVRAAVERSADLPANRLSVSVVQRPDHTVRVAVRFRAPTDVPIIGALLGDVVMTQAFTGWSEAESTDGP